MATKKIVVPEWVDANFPDWKKNLIGALRAFITGVVGVVAVNFTSLDADKMTDVNFWLSTVLVGAVSGGLIYLGKWLRDKFYGSSAAQKLPF